MNDMNAVRYDTAGFRITELIKEHGSEIYDAERSAAIFNRIIDEATAALADVGASRQARPQPEANKQETKDEFLGHLAPYPRLRAQVTKQAEQLFSGVPGAFDDLHGDGFMEFDLAIQAMNAMYRLPIRGFPSLMPFTSSRGTEDALSRIQAFERTLLKEISESTQVLARISQAQTSAAPEDVLNALVDLSDWLGDIVVYVFSEALKFGIPLQSVLRAIMESNFTKLDAQGNAHYDENGKFLKSDMFIPPEPRIRDILQFILSYQ